MRHLVLMKESHVAHFPPLSELIADWPLELQGSLSVALPRFIMVCPTSFNL